MKLVTLILIVWLSISYGGEWEEYDLRENGSIAVWTVAGPFPNSDTGFHDNSCFGYFKDYLISLGGERNVIAKEGDVIPMDGDVSLKWLTEFSQPGGLIDFLTIFNSNGNDPGVAYAFCQLISNREQSIMLKIRSNDGVKGWMNGEIIHDHHVGRTIEAEEDHVEVKLNEGINLLLFKIDQGGGKWGLSVRALDKENKPARDIKSSTFNKTLLRNRIQKADLETTHLIKNTAEGEKQVLHLMIFSGGLDKVKITLSKQEWEKPYVKNIDNLPAGKKLIELHIPPVTKTESANLRIESSSDQLTINDLVIPEVKKWKIYLVQQVHTDIGYTRPQTEILPEHLRFIDYALDFCDMTDEYPDDAKFRWTCEVTWPVREYLKRRPEKQIQRLVSRAKEGRIEIAGMFLNMSELAPEASLSLSLQPLNQIKKYGISIKTAMQNDVNGIGWCLVDYFQNIGIKYVTMGINKTRSVLPFDKPTSFWWESPSGKRVMAYRADHYHVGNYWKLHERNMAALEKGLLEYLKSLQDLDYPFNQIVVQYSGYHTDNSPPSTAACDLVKSWNETYTWPKLRIATAHEFLEDIEKKHGDKLPVYRVAWPDWWTDGFGSAARETAEARITQNSLQVSQGLLSMAALSGFALKSEINNRIREIQDDLLFYQEHTFGAAESISDPESENSMIQWGEKSSYVWEAVKKAGLLREEALGLLQPSVKRGENPTIVVFNTLNWKRAGLVDLFIDHEILPLNQGYSILDDRTGDPIPIQARKTRSEGTYWSLWVTDIPGMGFQTFSIVKDENKPAKSAVNIKISGNYLENDWYKLCVDTLRGGINSLYDKHLEKELCDQDSTLQIGQYIYERIPNNRFFAPGYFIRTGLKNIRIDEASNGPIWSSIRISALADGFDEQKGMQIEYKLYHLENLIEIEYRGSKNREKNAEACYVVFPFKSAHNQIIYEAQGGIVVPGETQLPGSSSDWHTIQNFVAIQNDGGQIVFCSPKVPLVQFGDINLSKWQYKAKVDVPHIYSWVMNNYWFTNFRAYQEGGFNWQYFITTTKEKGSGVASKLGWNNSIPLTARVLAPNKEKSGIQNRSCLSIENQNLLLVSSTPVEKGVMLHLREAAGIKTTVNSESLNNKRIISVDEVDVLGNVLKEKVAITEFNPYEVKFLKLSLMD